MTVPDPRVEPNVDLDDLDDEYVGNDEGQPDGDEAHGPERAERKPLSWHEARRPFLITVAAIAALVSAVLSGYSLGKPHYPADDSVDAGFARDMTAHHAQAVDMSLTIRSKSTSTDVRTLAYDVVTTQENQRGQMMAWLQTWGLPLAVSGQRMDWMKQTGHHHTGLPQGQMLLADGRMPGMASSAQLQQLSAATGKNAEILYLQLMIVHHRAGVEMAQAAVDAADRPEVVRLARSMVQGQTGEINLMTDMLKQRGAVPWPQGQQSG